ncbi:MAG: hypothetical protein KDD44_07345 [Bdellovibrionales bacterium]|nr:hypothetical protein [Bdellovibrionales bacterium]
MSSDADTISPPAWPNSLIVCENATEDRLTKRVMERLQGKAEISIVPNDDDPFSAERAPELETAERIRLGKRTLVLKRNLGSWFEHCPASAGNQVCCNLWVANLGEGCPMDCTYCYLQSYLQRNPTSKLFTNLKDLLGLLEQKSGADPGRLFRVGIGEAIDSLIWEELTDLSTELVPFFGRHPNLLLELKSKHDYVDNLVAMKDEHRGRTVVSWSMNAREVSDADERGTASLERRLAAAERCVAAGYRVGFHFDPLVYFDGCVEGYREVISEIFRALPWQSVAWVSIGTLRYRKEMKEMMRARFPQSRLPFGEHVLGDDQKLHYVQPLRLRLIRGVWEALREVSSSLPVYMCMETAAAWRAVSGTLPKDDERLDELMTRFSANARRESRLAVVSA